MNNVLATLVSYNSLSDEDKKLFKQVIKVRDEDKLDELKKLFNKTSEVDPLDIFKKRSNITSQLYVQPFSDNHLKNKSHMVCYVGDKPLD